MPPNLMPFDWRPELIIFDLDDTLIHEEATDEAVMLEVARPRLSGLAESDAAIIQAVRAAAREHWQRCAAYDYCRCIGTSAIEGLSGDYSGDAPGLRAIQRYLQDGYREWVWRDALRALGVAEPEGLAAALAAAYAAARSVRHDRFPEAEATLRRCAGRFRLALLTNGAPRLQWSKIEGSGFARFFEQIVVSGDFGVGKPDPAIYRHLLERVGLPPSAALMVGNSLPNDVVGAQQAGLRAVWFNPLGAAIPDGVRPDWTVASLAELGEGLQTRLPPDAERRIG